MGKITDYIIENQKESYDTLRLIASENLPCVDERLPFMMDMFARYVFIGNDNWKYPNYYLDDIEKQTISMFCKLLNCKYVSLKPISGLNGMMTTIAAYNRVGNIVMSLHPGSGGHGDTAAIIQKLGLKSEYLPFNKETWEIDIEALKGYENLEKISMVYIDLCMVTFPQPIRELKKVLSPKTILVYDASHVLGLIAGGCFQDPLAEGADILIANTHKTFPGPHKAIFCTNRNILKMLYDKCSSELISHHHIADIACLGIILEKYTAEWFREYAENITKNAKALSKYLYEAGVHVQLESLGFTSSHQIWIECGDKKQVDEIVDICSENKIIINGAMLPSLDEGWGIRLGVQEITRRGIKEDGLRLISDILAEIILYRRLSPEGLNKKEDIIKKHINDDQEKYKIDQIIKLLTK